MKNILQLLLVLACLPIFPGILSASETTERRILVPIEKGFNRTEFWVPVRMLEAAGHDVVVASTEPGIVRSRLNGKPDKRDATAEVALREVTDISSFDALFIPGGYSPGFLETDEDALRIVTAFMEADLPVAAICHGPRLLMAVDAFAGRVGTMLHTVPSEKADWWRKGKAAAYLDQPVVIDGNLITARYPNDAKPLGEALLRMLEGTAPDPVPTGPQAAWFALWPGFDEAVVLALLPRLKADGYEVGIAAPETGWVRGSQGYPLPVDTTYDALPEAALVIAPGGIWPKPGPARQAKSAPWVQAMEPALEARKAWIRNTLEAGGNVLLAGLDSAMVSGWEALDGGKVAASAQLEWGFPKGGPRWTSEPVARTAPNLWTCSGAPALPRVLKEALPELLKGIPAKDD